jgi:hypothetical protein
MASLHAPAMSGELTALSGLNEHGNHKQPQPCLFSLFVLSLTFSSLQLGGVADGRSGLPQLLLDSGERRRSCARHYAFPRNPWRKQCKGCAA